MKQAMVVLGVLVLGGFAVWFFVQDEKPGQVDPAENASPEGPTPGDSPGKQADPPGRTAPRAMTEVAQDDDPVGNLRLEGQVVDSTNLPVEGASVAVSSKPPRTVQTEKDGSFHFDKLVGRRFRLIARHQAKVGGPVLHKLSETSEPVIIRLRSGGVVEVTVVAADNRKPVPGALVELRTIDKLPAVTDPDGKATLTGVASGNSTVVAQATGFAPAHQFVMVPESTTEPVKIRMALERGTRVIGRVLDEDRQPLSGVNVLAVDTAALFTLADADRDGVATDEKGRFAIAALARGTYRLRAFHGDYIPASSGPVTVEEGRPTPDVEIVMKTGSLLSGRVESDSGQAVPWAKVNCSREDGRPFSGAIIGGNKQRGTTADGSGEFKFAGLPRAKLQLMALSDQASSAVTKVDLETESRVEDVVLRLTVTGRIAGRVVNPAGEPVAEVEVQASPDFWATGDAKETGLRGRSTVVTDGGGQFEFKGLADGTYRLTVIRSAGSFRRFLQQGVQAKTGDDDVELILEEDGGLKGRVVFAEGGNPAAFSVAVSFPPGVPVSTQDGSFELPEVAPGTYTVTFRGEEFADTEVPGVEVKEGEVADMGVVKVKRGRTVSGRVLEENGSAVPGATVVAAERLVGDGSNLVLNLGKVAEERMGLRQTMTDGDGYYRIGGVGTGRYLLVAEHEKLGRSAMVVVPEGVVSPTHDLTLHGVGSIEGKVTMQGKPVPGAVIQANAKGEAGKIIVVNAGDDGSYRIARIESGEHRVTAAVMGGSALGAKSAGRVVNVGPDEMVRVDIDIPRGDVTVTIDVQGQEGAAIDAAQVLMLAGKVDIQTADQLNKVAMSGGGSISQTFWLPVKPAEFKEVMPGEYSLCVIPINGNMNDPAFIQRLQKNTTSLRVYCSPFAVAPEPKTLNQKLTVPPMTPLPADPSSKAD